MTTHTTNLRYSRAADRPTELVGPSTLDPGPVCRDWLGPAPCVGGFERFGGETRDGRLVVRTVGAHGPRPGEWGTVAADVYAARVDSRSGYAVRASYDHGRLRSLIHTYMNVGVTALHSFHHLHEDDVPDYFTRQICVPARGPWPEERHEEEPTDLAGLRGVRPDPSGLVGSWVNTQAGAGGLGRLEFSMHGDSMSVRAGGAGVDALRDWGAVEAALYVPAANPTGVPTALATFDLQFVRVHLEARFNDGLLVVSQYAEFLDGSGRSDYMLREALRR